MVFLRGSETVLLRDARGDEGNGGDVETDSVLNELELTSVTSSMPSSKYTTSCIVS